VDVVDGSVEADVAVAEVAVYVDESE